MLFVKTIQRCVFLLFLLAPQMVLASEITIRYQITDSTNVGEMVHGQIQVEVQNLTNDEMKNVDLRVDSPGSVMLDKEVLQLGTISAGGMVVAVGQFASPASGLASESPFMWRVDHDAAGTHSQTIIPGIR